MQLPCSAQRFSKAQATLTNTWVLLDDEEATLLVTEATEHVCVAAVPGETADALGFGALTALLKENGRIRGTVTGDTIRRGVARTLAQQCVQKFEEACMPFQYALSTRAATDCVAPAPSPSFRQVVLRKGFHVCAVR